MTAQLQQLHDVSYGDAGDFRFNDAGDIRCNDADGCDGERSGYINGIAAAADENHNDNYNYVLLEKPPLQRYPHFPTCITHSDICPHSQRFIKNRKKEKEHTKLHRRCLDICPNTSRYGSRRDLKSTL